MSRLSATSMTFVLGVLMGLWWISAPTAAVSVLAEEGDQAHKRSLRTTPVVLAARKAGPSVVNFRPKQLVTRRSPFFSPMEDEIFRRFFGQPLPSRKF